MTNRLAGLLLVVSVLVLEAPDGAGGGATMEIARTGSKTIVVIGASYAGGWDPGRPIAGYRMVTRGVSGEQSSQILARFKTDALALKPDAVIIWGFINDVFRSDPARIDRTLARIRESLPAMVESARKAGVVPILATEVTVRGGSMVGRFRQADGKNSREVELSGLHQPTRDRDKSLDPRSGHA